MEFEEVDVSKDQKGLGELARVAKRMVVPVLVIGDEVIVGFDVDAIERALGAAG